jgi:preprotein translocase subunit SecB
MSSDDAPTKTRPRRKKTGSAAPPAPERPSREAYAEFIRGVELRDIRLTETHAKSHVSRFDSDALKIKVDVRGTIKRVLEPGRHGFEADVTIDLSATDDDGHEHATGESSYALLYTSQVEPTDGMLEVFLNLNVSVNAWPYLREHVQQTITRFGWNPLILPPLKTLSG